MATIQIKRNNSNAATKPSSLLVGELAGNLLDRSLFSSDGSNVFQFYTGTTKWFDTSGNANNANKLGGVAASSYLTGITSAMVTTALGYEPFNSTSFTKATIKSTLGIADWALAASKPTYTASEVGALSESGGTINGTLTVSRDAAVPFYIKNTQATNSLNQATLRFVIGSNYGAGLLGKSADNNLYRTDASLSATYTIIDEGNYANTTDKRYIQNTGGTISGYPALLTLKATSSKGDSWLQFTDADTTELYAIGLRRPASSYGLQYRVNDNYYTILHSNNYSSYALPLSGGTMSQNSKIKWANNVQSWDDLDNGFTAISTVRDNDYYAGLSFKGWYGFQIRAYGGDTDLIQARGATNTAWGSWRALIHSGNIGSQSVDFSNYSGYISEYNIGAYLSTKTASISGWYDWGNNTGESFEAYTHGLRITSPDASYYTYLAFGATVGLEPRIRYIRGGELGEWKTIALTDSNVASATKLQTARTIWGQSFDGSANVSGTLSGVGNIYINKENRIYLNDGTSSIDALYLYSALKTIFVGYGAGKTINTALAGNEVYLYYGGLNKGFTLSSSGNVLIGTTTDNAYKLQVAGSAYIDGNINLNLHEITNAKAIHCYDSGTGYYIGGRNYGLGATNGGALIYSYGDTPISFYTKGAERVHITGGGNVLIGTTTNNSQKLQVRREGNGEVIGLTSNQNWASIFYGMDNGQNWSVGAAVGGKFFFNYNSVGDVGHITSTGNIVLNGDGIFGSDARYKSKLQDLAVDIETIANAPVFSYKWTDREDDKVHLGTTAQYWLDTDFKDAVDTSNKDFYHLNYGGLGVAIGVTLAKEQIKVKSEVERLRNRVKELENQVKQLKQWHN